MTLNQTERLIVETIRMRLKETDAMKYLEQNGSKVTRYTYYKVKGALEANKLKRLHEIGMYGFVDQHLQRIDEMELIDKMMWENYWQEPSPYKRVIILTKIAEIQPYISAYYEATKEIIGQSKPESNSADLPPTWEQTATQGISK